MTRTADTTTDTTTYSLRRLQRTLGVSRGVVAGLVDAGFVAPSRGPRNEMRFSFRDVVLLRTAHGLQAARIPKAKILRSLGKLRATLPDALPLSGLRITAVGSEVVVHDGGTCWAADTGQLLMDFEVARVGGAVAILPAGDAAAVARAPLLSAGEALPGATGDALRNGDAWPGASATTAARAASSGDCGLAVAPADAARWFARGRALEATDPAAAEHAYRESIALAPGDADAYLNLGAMLCESGRSDAAIGLYDAALGHPRCAVHAALHYSRAVALEDTGRIADALAAYASALALDAGLADAHYNAARLHEQRGEAQQALRHYSAYRRLTV